MTSAQASGELSSKPRLFSGFRRNLSQASEPQKTRAPAAKSTNTADNAKSDLSARRAARKAAERGKNTTAAQRAARKKKKDAAFHFKTTSEVFELLKALSNADNITMTAVLELAIKKEAKRKKITGLKNDD